MFFVFVFKFVCAVSLMNGKNTVQNYRTRRSQASFPSSESGSCFRCGGTLTVSVEPPLSALDGGADAITNVTVDQVFLEPGTWGRYKGLHMHLEAAEWLLSMGSKMVRYGGTFTETVQGNWLAARGPAWLRPPCTAGRGVGGELMHSSPDARSAYVSTSIDR